MELIIAYIVAMMIVSIIFYDIKFINRETKIILIFIAMATIIGICQKLDYYGPVAIVLSFVIAQFVDLKKEVSKK
ncbi:hypothetical protein [Mammaliicoccus sciuri]|uniref:hypothetical protein n=1 Tax=Mammaliicoccus sciuri TaxID=1296 RepID=UPI002DB8EF98|nr:hypothetical protein [Mammaliicoccus sciuri]MEB7782267.1 hypothetical protein [Mammaliicoccus sciuri]